MAKRCFLLRGSNPAMCAVHSALLMVVRVPLDQDGPDLGTMECLMCPLTNKIVSEFENPVQDTTLQRAP